MDVAPAFASVGEAMDMARAALGYLAAADAAQLAAETQAECLPGLEWAEAVLTAGRASSCPRSLRARATPRRRTTARGPG
jgi:hypothetical protein